MPSLIQRVAEAKATCSDLPATLCLATDGFEQPPLFAVFIHGPVGVELRWFMETKDPKGATIDELEYHLVALKRAIGQSIEQHACHECDGGGVCDFFTENRIPLFREEGDYMPPGLMVQRSRIQTALDQDRLAGSIEEIVSKGW